MAAEASDGLPSRRARRRTGSYTAADGRRRAILETAISHFAQWGYFNSSMPKIASDVGISRAGLQHHFPSKEDLLAAVLQLRDQRAGESFYLPPSDALPDVPTLFEGIHRQAAFNRTEPGLTQMFSVVSAEAANIEHPAHDYFTDRYSRLTEFLAAVLVQAQRVGDIRSDVDAVEVAHEILAMQDGLNVQWALLGDSFDLEARLRAYLTRLASSITAEHPDDA